MIHTAMCMTMLYIVHGYTYNSPYVTYNTGNCSLIFSVPHGGSQQPTDIPDRTVCSTSDKPYRGCHLGDCICDFSHNTSYTAEFCRCNESPEDEKCKIRHLPDMYTKPIANYLRDEIEVLSGKMPYIIINELRRNKMDANRDKPEATFGVADAETAWEAFHERIQAAIDDINAPGLVIDLHGQIHSEGWTEFGYSLTRSQLASLTPNPRYSTICKLVKTRCGCSSHSNCSERILRGDQSLGNFLEQEVNEVGVNYVAVPSPNNTSPGSGGYYAGGYDIKRHGSEDCYSTDKTDAIQIEMPSKERKQSVPRAQYIKSLAKAIVNFMNVNYPNWNQ